MTTVLVILAAIALFGWLYFRRKTQTGLPVGLLVYDAAGQSHLEQPLVSHRYRLIGMPDYLVETEDGLIPVELKSSKCPRFGPYDAHLAQLMTYCVLVEDVLGKRVPYGILHYADSQIRIPYTADERQKIIDLADEIRACGEAQDVHRDHRHSRRCRGCGYRASCGEALS